jgi:Uma2 family endonuclease
MSSAPRLPSDLGYLGVRMTAGEFIALGETPQRLELVDGVVCMSPSASLPHQRLVREILFQLETFRRANPAVEVLADVDVVLTSGTVYRPDIIAYADARALLNAERAVAVPSLVVEVLSPATRAFDLTTKKDDYEKAGVAEYLVVEPVGARVRMFRRATEWLVELPVHGDSLASIALPGFALDLRPLRALSQ